MRGLKIQPFILLLLLLTLTGVGAENQPTVEKTFKAVLSGGEEVPPVKTNAKGEATLRLSPEGDKLTYTLFFSDVKDVTAAYIHMGKKGENGPPVFGLFSEHRKPTVSGTLLAEGTIQAHELIGPLKGKLLRSLVTLMEAGDAYINVHNKEHPDGEIRGQIE